MGKKETLDTYEDKDEKVDAYLTTSNSTGEKVVGDIEIKTPIEGAEGYHWAIIYHVDHADKDYKIEGPKIEVHDSQHKKIK